MLSAETGGSMHLAQRLVLVVVALTAMTRAAGAVTIDGKHDPAYGASLSTQTTQTSLGDGSNFMASELDEAYGYLSGDTLYVLLTGSFNRFFSEPLTLPNQLQLYVDIGSGGQNPLSGSNPNVGGVVKLPDMTGLHFDSDFSPDFWLAAARETFNQLDAYYAELPDGGGAAGYYLGASAIGGPGVLGGAGSFNPFGILASVDISNAAGVTAGCGAASGAGVTTGVEWAIPLAAIGNPAGAFRVCALLATAGVGISNQVLGPVPPGTCALGPPGGVDLETIPGAQYFTIDGPTPVTRPTWGRLKALYR
jgi:hypothetical protein